ncbi:MAG: hypoxanthine phosphoribosyltransferase [Thermoanaerobaculaceae bacterium]|jgi:hypoxanthine phosphoribosyltransferase|nr:hypoxanthine phosphoribosyltransferase [Thermoanaerobaculaceae bacterium]
MSEVRPTVLIDEATIAAKVAELAAQIDRDYAGVDELILVGVLKGAFIFLADLSRKLTIPRAVDFIALSTYANSTTTGAVRMIMDLRRNIEGKHVLVVEDIVDTGHTLAYLMKNLATRQPASLACCALVRKAERTEVEVPLRYLGFDIPNVWVVGYGLDWAERFRTLPYIGVVTPEA